MTGSFNVKALDLKQNHKAVCGHDLLRRLQIDGLRGGNESPGLRLQRRCRSPGPPSTRAGTNTSKEGHRWKASRAAAAAASCAALFCTLPSLQGYPTPLLARPRRKSHIRSITSFIYCMKQPSRIVHKNASYTQAGHTSSKKAPNVTM